MRSLRASALCGAALLACSSICHAGDALPGEKDQKAGAQQTFEAGGKLYDAHHFEEALAAFRASYQIVASPNSHLMIARCLRDLGRNVDAYREYEAVAKEAAEKGERYESAAHASGEEREELKQKIALLTLRVADPPAGLTVKIGEAPVDLAALGTAMPLEPATVVVTAQAPDGASARADLSLTPGSASDVELKLALPVAAAAPPPPPPTVAAHVEPPVSGVPLRTWAYVAGGVGVAGLATFGIFGAMSSSKYSSLQSSCPGRQCGPGSRDDISAGKSFQTIANVGLVLGVVGLGTGATLFILSRPPRKEGVAASDVRVQIGVGSVAMGGSF
jgi:hypothetical protein